MIICLLHNNIFVCTCVHRTLREELASKDATLKLTVSERDKQVEEKRNQAVTMG